MQLLHLATLLLTTTYAITIPVDIASTGGLLIGESQQDVAEAVAKAVANFNKFTKLANEVNQAGSTWEAHAHTRFDYDPIRIQALVSLRISDDEFNAMPPQDFSDVLRATNDTLPDNFAVWNKWPMCNDTISSIPDQGYCGACWAISTATALTDRLCTLSNGLDRRRLSYQDLTECCTSCGYGCNGGSIVNAFNYFVTTGLVTGSGYNNTNECKPYVFAPCTDPNWTKLPVCKSYNSTLTCRNTCQAGYAANYTADRVKGKSAYRVTGGEAAIMAELYNYGPVASAMMVYQDFMTYRAGVYKFTSGSYLGGHSLKIVGWGVENGVKYWLCVNSWSEFWGTRGFFKILRGVNHLQIENYAVAGLPK